MKKSLLLLLLIGTLGAGTLLAQAYSDTVTFGKASMGTITQVTGINFPEYDWSAQTPDPFPFTQQFLMTKDVATENGLSTSTVNVDVTVTVDANKYDETPERNIIDSLMYVYRFQEYRLSFGGDTAEGYTVPNGDLRQFNSDEVLTFTFDNVNNTPPNELYPPVQMGLIAITGWTNKPTAINYITLNGVDVGLWQGNAFYEPLITDSTTQTPVKVVIKQGDVLQIWGSENTYHRFNSLIMQMESTLAPTDLTLSAEGGTAEITENGGSLRILGEVTPADASDKRITWTVDDKGTGATINPGGILRANPRASGNGTVTVTGSVADGAIVKTLDVTISGQVDILVDSIYLYTTGQHIDSIVDNGGSLRIRAEVFPDLAANKDLVWSVEDNGTGATIDTTGLLTAKPCDDCNGTVTVKGTAADASGVFDTIDIVIINQETQFVDSISITFEGEFAEILVNKGTLQLTEHVFPESATDRTVTWSITDNGTGATIDQNGLLQAAGGDSGNGLVTVTVTANDGSGVAATLDVIIAGQTSTAVENIELRRAISIYPNPVNFEQLTVKVSDYSVFITSIEVYDITGKSVFRMNEFDSRITSVEVPMRRSTGLYLIKIETDRGSVIEKIVKNK